MTEVSSLQADDQPPPPASTQKHTTTTPTQPPLPHAPATTKKKGIVLGPDGKPCRTCNTYQDFFGATASSSASSPRPFPTGAPTSAPIPRDDCPPDVEQLGRASWTLLHSIAATYPSTATPSQQADMSQFLQIFGRIYPCWSCAADFRAWMAAPKPGSGKTLDEVVKGRKTLGKWLCEAHNDVNQKLGKNVFDCGRWEERWRTGGEGC
ncbi:hepatopoietin protein [Tricharina praecox]|uniref:hepatopoietin protein n=1 Tax=Tricharina praecox TaxID=43433 RepID=UPI00221E7D11|nr:hepatopoietin protein [Tricharina praecox]KAI5857905.1 hepatopoietin protein [Tricharina praecox]